MECPRCNSSTNQCKAGLNPSRSQSYECGECHKINTPKPNSKGHAVGTGMLALRLYVEGNSQMAIARVLKISPQTIGAQVSLFHKEVTILGEQSITF